MTGPSGGDRAREQARARYPDVEGYVERDGVRLFYEAYGSGERTILLLPTWSIVHSRVWKAQIPYLARHARVVTFDAPGNGRSDRPQHAAAYEPRVRTAEALAVLDATGTTSATLVCLSRGSQEALLLAAEHPERVDGAIFIAPALAIAPGHPERIVGDFDDVLDTDEGWAKDNAHYWRRDYQGYLEFFFSQCLSEPHSTKQIEDCISWAMQTDAETLIATARAPAPSEEEVRALCARVRAPVLVLHGEDDRVSPLRRGQALAEATGGRLVTLEGSGHVPQGRDPVKVNHLIRDFVCPPPPPPRWTSARTRRKRALFICSPIGLGHAQRDIAIADELRKLHPDVEIDWLAQHPVTRVLEAEGERIHPASAYLSNESSHIESESAEHDLHAFQAIRRMDEILLANFMVFDDLVRDEAYDLWVGDEAWELDHFLHENPELKRAPYAWLTDFVGWLPMPDGGDREAALTADYNAEMIEHIARYPRLRDRALFVGEPDDIVPHDFGPDLPAIRSWTEEHYDFPGYITGFDPVALSDREALRAELGYQPDEAVCLVTVGGSGVGGHLLRRVVQAFPLAKSLVPQLRMVVVTGPRLDPDDLPAADGLEVRSYVHGLYRHLAACDLAVVQGGLTTTMELTAGGRPFLYFPLRHHFEQTFHVRHRLERHGAGRAMDFATDGPEQIAEAIADELGRPVQYRPVDGGGAARAAALLGELL
jgi:pimeloyl-ACP methyl ester carboxylesterase/predicted glycosyltransferase